MKEFGRGMYIDGTTVAECGNGIWNKFRQYVKEKLGGYTESTGYYYYGEIDCSIALDNEDWLMWCEIGTPLAGEQYTQQDILDILTHYGYIEPSVNESEGSVMTTTVSNSIAMKITDVKVGDTPKQQEKYKMFTRDMLKPGMFCKCRNGSVFVVTENGRFADVTGDDAGYSCGCYYLVDALTTSLANVFGKSEYDVVAISHTFDFTSPIWERDIKEEEREKIRQEISELEASLKAKKEALENI